MAQARQHFEDAARDAMLALDRLVGVGIRAKRDGFGLVARPGKLPLQQFRCIGFRREFRLEIEARRQPEIGVAGPREAIGTAMLAAPIGVDGAVERDIGRPVPRDDGAGLLQAGFGAKRRRGLFLAPAIVEHFTHLRLMTTREVADRTPPVAVRIGDAGGIPGFQRLLGQAGDRLAHEENKSRTSPIRQGARAFRLTRFSCNLPEPLIFSRCAPQYG